jgi:hypothetical protein
MLVFKVSLLGTRQSVSVYARVLVGFVEPGLCGCYSVGRMDLTVVCEYFRYCRV